MRYERATDDVGRRARTDFGVGPCRYVFVDRSCGDGDVGAGPGMAVLWRELWCTLRASILDGGVAVRR